MLFAQLSASHANLYHQCTMTEVVHMIWKCVFMKLCHYGFRCEGMHFVRMATKVLGWSFLNPSTSCNIVRSWHVGQATMIESSMDLSSSSCSVSDSCSHTIMLAGPVLWLFSCAGCSFTAAHMLSSRVWKAYWCARGNSCSMVSCTPSMLFLILGALNPDLIECHVYILQKIKMCLRDHMLAAGNLWHRGMPLHTNFVLLWVMFCCLSHLHWRLLLSVSTEDINAWQFHTCASDWLSKHHGIVTGMTSL